MSKSKGKIENRCRSGGFAPAYHDVTRSKQFLRLKPVSKCLVFQLNGAYIPISRENISVSVVNAAKWIGCNKDTAGKAFKELESAGFIKLIEHHIWQRCKARVYRLTWRQFKGREPTDEWKDA
jgi:hypothetical protein